MMRAALALGLLARATVAAPRIYEFNHSGNGCPQDAAVEMTSEGASLVFTFPPAMTAVLNGPDGIMGRTKNCAVHLNMDSGIEGHYLEVQDITVSGSYFSSGNSTATIFESVFWSEDASNTYTGTHSLEMTGPSLSSVGAMIPVGDNLVGKCVGSSGAVGILNVNMRVNLGGDSGVVAAFLGSEADPVTETITFAWKPCGDREVEFEESIEAAVTF